MLRLRRPTTYCASVKGFCLAYPVLNNHRLESSLKQMSNATVPPIEPDAVTDVEPLHSAGQVGLGGFDQLMKMVVHQHISMNSDAESFRCLGEQLQEMETIRIVAVNGLALVATGRDLVTTAWPLDAQGSCHGAYRNPNGLQKSLLSIVEM